MAVTLSREKLDPRLYVYLEKRKKDGKINEGMLGALKEIFENTKLPVGDLVQKEEDQNVDFEETEKRVMDSKGNELWKPLLRLDFYIYLYKKTEEEIKIIKKETALILSVFI